MKLKDAIEFTINNILKSKYKEVQYVDNETVRMSSNFTIADLRKRNISLDTEVELITNRFDIQGEIDAVIVNFDVKFPRKRKFIRHQEFYRFV